MGINTIEVIQKGSWLRVWPDNDCVVHVPEPDFWLEGGRLKGFLFEMLHVHVEIHYDGREWGAHRCTFLELVTVLEVCRLQAYLLVCGSPSVGWGFSLLGCCPLRIFELLFLRLHRLAHL